METDGVTKTSLRSELRQSTFSLHCAGRTRKDMLSWCRSRARRLSASSVSKLLLSFLVLHAHTATEIDKSEDFSLRKTSSHMHQTHHNKEVTCYNIILGVANVESLVLRMLFAKPILVICLREISSTINAGSHEPGMLSGQEKVL